MACAGQNRLPGLEIDVTDSLVNEGSSGYCKLLSDGELGEVALWMNIVNSNMFSLVHELDPEQESDAAMAAEVLCITSEMLDRVQGALVWMEKRMSAGLFDKVEAERSWKRPSKMSA